MKICFKLLGIKIISKINFNIFPKIIIKEKYKKMTTMFIHKTLGNK